MYWMIDLKFEEILPKVYVICNFFFKNTIDKTLKSSFPGSFEKWRLALPAPSHAQVYINKLDVTRDDLLTWIRYVHTYLGDRKSIWCPRIGRGWPISSVLYGRIRMGTTMGRGVTTNERASIAGGWRSKTITRRGKLSEIATTNTGRTRR